MIEWPLQVPVLLLTCQSRLVKENHQSTLVSPRLQNVDSWLWKLFLYSLSLKLSSLFLLLSSFLPSPSPFPLVFPPSLPPRVLLFVNLCLAKNPPSLQGWLGSTFADVQVEQAEGFSQPPLAPFLSPCRPVIFMKLGLPVQALPAGILFIGTAS